MQILSVYSVVLYILIELLENLIQINHIASIYSNYCFVHKLYERQTQSLQTNAANANFNELNKLCNKLKQID